MRIVKFVLALILWTAVILIPFAGYFIAAYLFSGFAPKVGYRRVDAFIYLVPVMSTVWTIRILWRLTAREAYWSVTDYGTGITSWPYNEFPVAPVDCHGVPIHTTPVASIGSDVA